MTNLENMSVKELKDIAKENNVEGWRNMKKAELIEVLSNTESKEMVFEIELDTSVHAAPEVIEPEFNVNILSDEESDSEAKPDVVRKNQKRLIEYKGKVQSLTAWAKELGIRHQTLYNRIVMKGWDVEQAFETPIKKEVTASAEGPEVEQ